MYRRSLSLVLWAQFRRSFTDIVDQDQTALNVQSDRESTLSSREICFYCKNSLYSKTFVFDKCSIVSFHLLSKVRPVQSLTTRVDWKPNANTVSPCSKICYRDRQKDKARCIEYETASRNQDGHQGIGESFIFSALDGIRYWLGYTCRIVDSHSTCVLSVLLYIDLKEFKGYWGVDTEIRNDNGVRIYRWFELDTVIIDNLFSKSADIARIRYIVIFFKARLYETNKKKKTMVILIITEIVIYHLFLILLILTIQFSP